MNPIELPAADARELAAAAAHSLNNVIAVLYAAASHLESAPNPRSLERATRALGDASGSALCLSAALSLLALPSAASLHVPAGAQQLHPEDMDRLAEALQTATHASSACQDLPKTAMHTTLDRDTLQSLLLCAAALLRRAAGRDAVLHCAARLTHAPAPEQLEFELRCDAATSAGSTRSSRDPCELALIHVLPVLPVLGVQLDRSRPGRVLLRVDIAGGTGRAVPSGQ